jgi:hypothetical protein
VPVHATAQQEGVTQTVIDGEIDRLDVLVYELMEAIASTNLDQPAATVSLT